MIWFITTCGSLRGLCGLVAAIVISAAAVSTIARRSRYHGQIVSHGNSFGCFLTGFAIVTSPGWVPALVKAVVS